MSKLEELLIEFCPNGVPVKMVKEVYTRLKGTSITAGKMKEIACGDGEIRVFAGGKTVINAHEEDIPKANITRVPAVLVQSRGVIDVVYYEKPFTFKNEMWAYTSDNSISVKYLFYVLKNNVQSFRDVASGMGSLPQISLDVTENFKIPIPPLEVQREIVRILDSFTSFTEELKDKLTAEFTARKKQYNYYRDTLLSFDNIIKKVKLKDIAVDIYRGAGIKREEVTETGIPCVRYGEIYTTYNTWFNACVSHTKLEYVSNPKYFEYGDILFAITGESVEDIAKSVAYIGNEKCLAGGDIVVLKHTQEPRYLAHVLSTYEARQQKSKGKIKSKVVHSSVPAIGEIEIPLPPMEVQRRYADVLDNFEKICNDLNIGLPAEIEARKKQYEYYRDILLTFAETGEIIPNDTTRHDTTRHDTTRHDTTRHDTTRHDTTRHTIIRLIQYVFGYVAIELKDVANYSSDRIDAGLINENTYVSVENILPDRRGKIRPSHVATEGRLIRYSTEDILIGNIRPYLKKIWFADCCGGTNGDVLVIQANTDLIYPRFLYMVLCSDNFFEYDMQNSKGAKMPRGNKVTVMKYQFCIPIMERQKEIVEILDRFDTLCNDISEGLPAEIEARRKQYEYYRDKLLTFKELKLEKQE